MYRYIILAALLFTITKCSSISVSSDYDPAKDFDGYKTFAVFKDVVKGSELEKAPLIKARVLDAIERTMIAKGFSKVELADADLVVHSFAGTKDKLNVTDWGYSYGGYWRGYPYGRNIDVTQYTEATLVLDLVDGKNDELIWRGIGTGVLSENKTPAEKTEAVDNAVRKILGEYPPEKK